jgi:hypothetical protein
MSAELGPYNEGGLRIKELEAFKRERGITHFFGEMPEDFDDPLPEDILVRPLPDVDVKVAGSDDV